MDTAEKAALLRSLHRAPPLLVLPNAWDVASGRVLAALAGCRALATTSAGVARSLGFEDGELAPAEEMIDAAGRIAAAVELPVSGDLERGYGDPPGTARAAWEVGLSGINFEDSTHGAMVALDEQTAAIAEIRAAAPGLVVNARIDLFLRGEGVGGSRRGGRARERLPGCRARTASTRSCARPRRSASWRGASTARSTSWRRRRRRGRTSSSGSASRG